MFAIGAWHKRKKNYISQGIDVAKTSLLLVQWRSIVFVEIKAIIKHPDYKIDVDLDALNEYLLFKIFFLSTHCLGVNMLPSC